MIYEDYVNVKVAKLLKEKGFDWEVHRSYLVNDNCFVPADVNDLPYRKDAIRIPTLQMAMKWLREVYDLHIIAYPWRANKEERATHWCCQVYKSFNLLGYEKYTDETPKSYEEACSTAIEYCLENLI